MQEDNEGFLYPIVDKGHCIECGLCEKVCPCLNQGESKEPKEVYAAINPNDNIRLISSSGGIFTMLAEAILDEGGVVFGVRFDENWEVKHDFTESKEGLAAFRGSKYVQSRIGDTYKLVKEFLKRGRKVLYTGTSCQIAGLKLFLRKDYDNLITMDLVCHGVPSPLVWREYLKSIPAERVVGKNSDFSSLNVLPLIKGISFRDKRLGWKKYGFSVQTSASKAEKNTDFPSYYKDKDSNPYLVGFLSNVFLRPSCYSCPSKNGKSNTDISLADYWGVENEHPNMESANGVSSIIVYTDKGIKLVGKIPAILEESTLLKFTSQNPAYSKSTKYPENRTRFWKSFKKQGVQAAISKYAKPSFKESFRMNLIKIVDKLGLVSILKKIFKR